MPRILAIDASLVRTGIVYPDGHIESWSPKAKGDARLDWFHAQLSGVLGTGEIDCCYIEGYAYGRPNQAHQIGELGGVLRLALFQAGVPCIEVAPTALKKWATGKGKANKDAMLLAAVRKYGFPGDNNDEADAWLLWHYAQSEQAAH